MSDGAAGMLVTRPALRDSERWLLAITSGILLALPYLHPQLFVLTWVGFVPLLIATHQRTAWESYRLGLVGGLAFYYLAANWMTDFLGLFKGYGAIGSLLLALAFWVYCAQLPALLFATYRILLTRFQAPAMLAFPLLAAVFYAHFPMMFPVQLGESQSHFPAAIQATAFAGVYGLDAILALCNVALAQWLLSGFRQRSARPSAQVLAAILLVTLWLGYGVYSHGKWDRAIAEWPRVTVGLVQPNEYPDTGTPTVHSGYSRAFPPEMAMTERLASSGAELVIWPEARFKGYFSQPHVAQAYQQQVATLGVALLFQDMEPAPTPEARRRRHYNAVKLLQRNGEPGGHYRKVKRVAFGETLPVIEHVPVLRAWLESYLGDFFHEIAAGDKPSRMQAGSITIVPLICYETLFPIFSAHSVGAARPQTLLVGLSSNAWFGSTRQPHQHLHASRLRAVENRLPLVHVLNNGPSAVILPNGRMTFETPFDTAGGFLADVPLAPQASKSFFGKFPYGFISVCYFLLLGLLTRRIWPFTVRPLQADSRIRTSNSTELG